MSEPSPEWTPPESCDQCSHPISEHMLWKPDAVCGGWIHCCVAGCQCWHDWPLTAAQANVESRMLVERVDRLSSRPGWLFVTGVVEGEPLHVGDTVLVQRGNKTRSTTVRTIEIHPLPGKTTIVLDTDLEDLAVEGAIVSRRAGKQGAKAVEGRAQPNR
ncbi:hypothetical protein [Nocardia sp. CA-145437]|uniref:hypothetical protein n=1 Tax=Nocardia sp. CA-145437 TaxID=3239980 RepID=UPI003D97EC5D